MEAPIPGLPLDGVRILALEQMQALPNATQLRARLGVDVVKVERPEGGDSGLAAQRSAVVNAAEGPVSATFLRNGGKRSTTVAIKADAGRDLISQYHQVERLADVLGHPEWKDDQRLESLRGWADQLDDTGDGLRRPGRKPGASSNNGPAMPVVASRSEAVDHAVGPAYGSQLRLPTFCVACNWRPSACSGVRMATTWRSAE